MSSKEVKELVGGESESEAKDAQPEENSNQAEVPAIVEEYVFS